MDIEAHLKSLGIVLPAPPAPVASYVPYTLSGRQIFVSGQLPMADSKIQFTGHLGGNLSVEQGQAAARLCAINVLAQLKAASGDLARVRSCLKLGVFISATADFTQHPEVANGASELISSVLCNAGRHSRSSVGVQSLPRGAAVEVDAVFELA